MKLHASPQVALSPASSECLCHHTWAKEARVYQNEYLMGNAWGTLCVVWGPHCSAWWGPVDSGTALADLRAEQTDCYRFWRQMCPVPLAARDVTVSQGKRGGPRLHEGWVQASCAPGCRVGDV